MPLITNHALTFGVIALPCFLAAIVLAVEVYRARRFSSLNVGFFLLLLGVGWVTLSFFVARAADQQVDVHNINIGFTILLIAMPLVSVAIIRRSWHSVVAPAMLAIWMVHWPPPYTGNPFGDAIRQQLRAWD